jgi:hypothetical protein
MINLLQVGEKKLQDFNPDFRSNDITEIGHLFGAGY